MAKRKRMKSGKLDDDNNDGDKQMNNHGRRVPHLSENIIFNILSRGSAEFLQNIGRSVCKSWAATIYSPQCIEKHMSHSNPIIFFKRPEDDNPLFYIEHRGKKLRDFDFEEESDKMLLDSSTGLMLYDDLENENLFVRNSITSQISKLPYPLEIMDSFIPKMNVSYLSLTGEVKVICNYRSFLESSTPYLWSVFTIGSDSNMTWRMLHTTTTLPKSPSYLEPEPFLSFSLGVLVIYWKESFSSTVFLAVDLQDESFHLVHLPSICCDDEAMWDFIPMGRELYVVSLKKNIEILGNVDVDEDDKEYNTLRVWKMINFRQSEWMEVFSIKLDVDLEAIIMDRDQFWKFLAWYDSHKILVYLTYNDRIMAHNFKVRRSYFITNYEYNLKYCMAHTNSLVRW